MKAIIVTKPLLITNRLCLTKQTNNKVTTDPTKVTLIRSMDIDDLYG